MVSLGGIAIAPFKVMRKNIHHILDKRFLQSLHFYWEWSVKMTFAFFHPIHK